MTKFATNNNKSASTKLFSFFITKDLHPWISFDIIELSDIIPLKVLLSKKFVIFSRNMETTNELA